MIKDNKTCASCKELKSVIEFSIIKRQNNKRYLFPYCKSCSRKIKREGYHKNKHKNLEKKNAYSRMYYSKNREKQSIRKAQFYKDNKSKVDERNNEWMKSNREQRRKTSRRWVYRHTLQMTEAQIVEYEKRVSGPCDICGELQKGKKCHAIDHDHVTGHIRGVLCHLCNAALGAFQDNPINLQKALDYLQIAQNSSQNWLKEHDK